ncbi:peptidase M16 inactive domain-containing protein [Cryptosporidium muris RN66]|uniref:Peptidase M16 inactive domain-containing protein n=1 Tax=Cryptosporidium muris (strain RN66) TaxID=441375 RepID=B6AII5_CRYMR|nr:peptidase M16 inactive domain-containing protein [Cryptosporidium muris RN66]EEA08026.1 peptidase M16 inactive domain-containing protein [Cryptosporidium muris RN66]|eukprot:XP_002142375.1 peptidase M16 inactive domain-containing protein [Cryptosporidium muris RN66]
MGSQNNIIKDEEFIKPITEYRKFRYYELNNKIKVFLIHDSNAVYSNLALSISVGKFMGFYNNINLPSFLLYGLFMGSRKFPSIHEFDNFLSSHGGEIEKEITDRNSYYYLGIPSNYLNLALKRFSEFFKTPLFDRNGLINQLRRFSQIFRDYYPGNLLNTSELIHEISYLNSLNKINCSSREFDINNEYEYIRNEIIKFFREYYSADLMTLIIIDSKPFNILEKYVSEFFLNIQNNNKILSTFHISDKNVEPLLIYIGKIIHVKYNNPINKIKLIFPITYKVSNDKLLSFQYIIDTLGHRMKGSLVEFLKQRCWIEDLSLFVSSSEFGYSFIEISIDLTYIGINYLAYILKSIYASINILKNKAINPDIIDDRIKIEEINFYYRESLNNKELIYTIIENYSSHRYLPNEVLIGNVTIDKADTKDIQEAIKILNPKNMILIIFSQNFVLTGMNMLLNNVEFMNELKLNMDNKFYNSLINDIENSDIRFDDLKYKEIKYHIEKLHPLFLNYLDKVDNVIQNTTFYYDLPDKNECIPSLIEDYTSNIMYQQYPIPLKDAINRYLNENYSEGCRVKLSMISPSFENIFYFPILGSTNVKTSLSFRIMTHVISKSSLILPKALESTSRLLSTLNILYRAIEIEISSIIYSVTQAGNNVKLLVTKESEFGGSPFGLEILLLGYYPSLIIFIENFFTTLSNLNKIAELSFQQAKFNYQNYLKFQIYETTSIEQSLNALSDITLMQNMSYKLLMKQCSKIKLEDVIELANYIAQYGEIEGLIVGNLDPIRAHKLINNILKWLKHNEEKYHVSSKIDITKSIKIARSTTLEGTRDSIEYYETLDLLSLVNSNRNTYYYQLNKNINDKRSHVLLFLGMGAADYVSLVLLNMLKRIMSRISQSGDNSELKLDINVTIRFHVIGSSFAGLLFYAESTNRNIKFLTENILKFYRTFFESDNSISLSDFEEARKQYLHQLHFKPTKLVDISNEFYSQLVNRQIKFNTKISKILYLQNLNYEKLNSFSSAMRNSPKVIIATQSQIGTNLDELCKYSPIRFQKITSKDELFYIEGIRTYKFPLKMSDKY